MLQRYADHCQRLTRSLSKAEIPSVTIVNYYAPLAQLDRASASDAEGQRFESSRARQPNKKPLLGLFVWPMYRVFEPLTDILQT